MAKKNISPEDRELFRQTVGKVRRIKTDTILPAPVTKPKPYPRPVSINVYDSLEKSIEPVLEPISTEDSLSFLAPGLSTKVLKRLRQGYFGTASQIDLHGLTSSEAQHRLLNFLQFCIENGQPCAHIIHGKGYGSQHRHPILKNHLNSWLRQHKNVQAFCSASQNNGGTGAVLVLLKVSSKYLGQEDDYQ